MGSSILVECPSCGKKTSPLFELTGEDIQRVNPPGRRVCWECREKIRSAARLEVTYHTGTATRDMLLMTASGFSGLVLISMALSGYSLSIASRTIPIVVFLEAATALTGMRMVYVGLNARYRFTHSLRWSLHSRYVVTGASLLLAGILSAIL